MDSAEGTWQNGKLPARLTTSTGGLIQWQTCVEQKKGDQHWADYVEEENLAIDAALQTGKRPVTLGIPPDSWTVDLNRMVQINDNSGTERRIRRLVILQTLPKD
jgi:hypothetical protein